VKDIYGYTSHLHREKSLPTGLAENDDLIGEPYTTLMFTNGPGFQYLIDEQGHMRRPNITQAESESVDYQQQTAVKLSGETHGGEDVIIYGAGIII
jgi:alkaline phosphatase